MTLTAAIVPFLRAWDYGLVDLDDYIYIQKFCISGFTLNWEWLVRIFTDVDEGIWMPLTYLSYVFDHWLWGGWYGGYHLTSIFIHAINVCLVWHFLRRLSGGSTNEAVCLIGALLWAVHPLRCESVVFIASRKDLLSFFFELLALVFWLKPSRTVLSIVFFILGALCKPSVMTFPVLCFLVDCLVVREVRPIRYVVPCILMVGLALFAGWQQAVGGATVDLQRMPLWGRIVQAMAAFGIYLRNTVWPNALAVQCLKRWPELPRFWFAGMLISGCWAYVMWRLVVKSQVIGSANEYFRSLKSCADLAGFKRVQRWHSNPSLHEGWCFILAGMAWFAFALVPMLGIANFGFHAYADRFTYIPAIGLSLMLIGIFRILDARRRPRRLALSAVSASIVLLGIVTYRQTGYWENDFKLFSHTLEVDGEENTFAHRALAQWYFEFPHDLGKCVEEYEKVIVRDPFYLLTCYQVYILALSEVGREKDIAAGMDVFTATVKRVFGAEKARRILQGDEAEPSGARLIHTVHDICKLCWWLSDASCLQQAGNFIRLTEDTALNDDPFFVYLKSKYERMVGENSLADRDLERLRSGQLTAGYIQFRYLRQPRQTGNTVEGKEGEK